MSYTTRGLNVYVYVCVSTRHVQVSNFVILYTHKLMYNVAAAASAAAAHLSVRFLFPQRPSVRLRRFS